MATPAAVCQTQKSVFSPVLRAARTGEERSTSLTSTVAHTVRNDSVRDIGAASLSGAIAQTEAEVGVFAEARGVGLAVVGRAPQVGLLAEHVLNAGTLEIVSTLCEAEQTNRETYATLRDGVDVLGVDGTNEGADKDGGGLHLDCWFWVLSWWVIVAAR